MPQLYPVNPGKHVHWHEAIFNTPLFRQFKLHPPIELDFIIKNNLIKKKISIELEF